MKHSAPAVLKLLIFFLLLTGLLVSCAPGGAPVPGETAAPEEELVIAVFEGGYGTAYWHEIAAAFEEAHPGVAVRVIAHPQIGDVIRPNIIAGNPPDFIYLPSTNDSYVTRIMTQDRAIEDITDVLEGLDCEFLPGFLDSPACSPYGDGHVYLAPIYYTATGLWYNRDFFEKNNIAVPQSWDEFFALGDRSREELGRALFTYQGLHPSYIECLIIPAIASNAGEPAMRACERFEEGAWRNPKVVETLENIARIGTEGYLLEGSIAADYMTVQSQWLMGQALFHPNGGWVENEMKGYPREEGFQFGFCISPVIDPEAEEKYVYAAIDEMFIPKAARHKELAKEFLAFQYSREAIRLNARLANGIPPVKGAAREVREYLTDSMYQAYSIFDRGYEPYIFYNYGKVDDKMGLRFAIYDQLGSVFEGTMTVPQWLDYIERTGEITKEQANEPEESQG